MFDLSAQQFVSTYLKADCILILLESFTPSEMLSSRICCLETCTSLHRHSLLGLLLPLNFLLLRSYLLCFHNNFMCQMSYSTFPFIVFFLFPPLEISILLKVSNQSGSLLLVKVGSTKKKTHTYKIMSYVYQVSLPYTE